MKGVAFLFLFLHSFYVSASIASTSPAITEVMIELGLQKKLKAISSYCKKIEKLPRVGSSLRPDFEGIIKSGAKIVYLHKSAQSSKDDRFKKLGLKVHSFNFNTLSDILFSIEKIAHLNNVKAEKIIKRFRVMKKKLLSLKLQKRVLGVVGIQKKLGKITGLYVVGHVNHYHDLIQMTGSTNSVSFKGHKLLNREQLLKLKVDSIWYFLTPESKNVIRGVNIWKEKEQYVFKSKSAQSVGVKVITFMKELYEKLSS